MTDPFIGNELAPQLTKDEKLIWTGKPRTGVILRTSDAFLIPFSILWGGFAFFWESTVVSVHAPLLFRIWGIPFVLVGIYMIIGRFFFDAKRRANTIYGITNNRIIIKSGVFNKEIKSLNIKTLSDLTISEKTDGSGTIVIGPVDLRSSMTGGIAWPGVKQIPQLEFIEKVQETYNLIINLQKQ